MKYLEDYVRDNRKKMDIREPSKDIWHKVEKGVFPKHRKLPPFQLLKIAAAISLLIVSIGIYQFLAVSPRSHETAADQLMWAINEQYAQEIISMKQNIHSRQEEVEKYVDTYPEVKQYFSQDIQQLNTTYNDLQQNLMTINNDRILFQAMIANLKMQMELLNQQLKVLDQIQKMKQHENSNPTI